MKSVDLERVANGNSLVNNPPTDTHTFTIILCFFHSHHFPPLIPFVMPTLHTVVLLFFFNSPPLLLFFEKKRPVVQSWTRFFLFPPPICLFFFIIPKLNA